MEQPILVQIGTMTDRGVVTMFPPMQQIIRCLFIRYIRQAEKGQVAAREMLQAKMRPMREGQLDYFKNAASYVGHKLATFTGSRLNLKDELEIVSKITDEQPIPPEWLEYVTLAELMGVEDEPSGTSQIGGGDVVGVPSGKRPRKAGGRKRKADGLDTPRPGRQVPSEKSPVRPGRAKRV